MENKTRKLLIFLFLWSAALSVYLYRDSLSLYIWPTNVAYAHMELPPRPANAFITRNTLSAMEEKQRQSTSPAGSGQVMAGSGQGTVMAGSGQETVMAGSGTKTVPSSGTKTVPSPGTKTVPSPVPVSTSQHAAQTPTPSLPTTSTTANPTISDGGPKLLCVRFAGRLGNELFEYASTLGLAMTLKRTPVFLGSTILHKVLKNFTVSSSSLSAAQLEERCNKARGQGEHSCCKFTEQLTRLDPGYDYKIGSYLQSYKYFDNHQAAIRKAVTFNDDIQTRVKQLVSELRQRYNSSTLIGVHIRHGDLASDNKQRIGYPLATPDFINRSVAYFTYLYPRCVFVVASDSVQWCRDHFPPGHTAFYLEHNEPAIDMMTLASMDHVVLSFGTFTWWIGYLNTGKVVYMKDFIRANTYIGNQFHPQGRDYIYPGWIGL